MDLCSEKHDEMVYDGRICPACDKIGDLDDEIEGLKAEIAGLEKELAAAEDQSP